MDIIKAIEERRSIRKFKDEKVERKLIEEIVSISSWAPSWKNFQIARYTIVDNKEIINTIRKDAVNDFVYNVDTLENAKGVVILSFVKNKSGKLTKDEYATTKHNSWEVFDAGIACQTFCLAAHAKGVGTVIMGIFDEAKIAQIVNIPENETVAALIAYGYADETPKPPKRKEVQELIRFID